MKRLILAIAALAMSSPALAAVDNPPPLASNSSLVDAADILTPEQEQAIEAQTREVYDVTHHHIVVLTMPTLNGADVRDYINNAFRYYKIGNRTRNDGVLLLVSMKDPRRLQIEVGYGLEGVLTDATSTQITDAMKTQMRGGDYYGAIAGGIQNIASVIQEEVVTPQKLAETAPGARTAVQKAEDSDTGLAFLIILGLIVLGVGGFFLVNQIKAKRAKAARDAQVAGFINKAKRALLEGDLDEAERQYNIARTIDFYNGEVSSGLQTIRRKRVEIAEAARVAREAAESKKPKPIVERVIDTLRKPAAPVGRTPTSSRSYAPPAPPKRDEQRERNAAAAVAAEQARQAERRRQQQRDDDDRRRRDEEDRRSRDSWSSSYSSSSSSSSWSSSDSSSSSSSYDSGGSSGGGGGGSDW